MKKTEQIYRFTSISQLLKHAGQPPPLHPLIALVDYQKTPVTALSTGEKIILSFYKISFKTKFSGQVKYGQGYYDFEEGGLAFLKPNQVVFTPDDPGNYEGYALYFHPDLIRHHPLAHVIARYGFFSYAVHEALFLSAREKEIVGNLFSGIQNELETSIDVFSENVLVSQIELLLSYCQRYYNRQFITRKAVNHNTLTLLDEWLSAYFVNDKGLENGLPAVQHISSHLGVSVRYLSDVLRLLTGQTTQQYVQNAVIEHSKDLLSTTSFSVSEIAYKLGFEHPQSFSKLFKNKMEVSPLQYRASFSSL